MTRPGSLAIGASVLIELLIMILIVWGVVAVAGY